MKITLLGKLVLLLLILGAAAGGYRFFQQQHGNSKQKPSSSTTTTNSTNPNSTNTNNTASNEIQIVTNPAKKGWLNDEIAKFNASQSDIKVVAKFVPTREAMHSMLAGDLKPALWSPSSIIWADRLAEEIDKKHSNKTTLVDTGEPESYRAVLRSPMVFLTTKEKANFLKPLLSSENCWSNILALNTGKKSAPWGKIKWAHADPLNANSGMLTLALILADYASRTNQSASIAKVATSAGFISYLKDVERRIVYDTAVEKGSTALLKSFAEDNTRYDFITAYEASAMGAVADNPDLAVIYPNPTANAENAVAFLNWDSLNEEQRAGARNFLKFVSSAQSAQDGLKEYFRPLRGASLNDQITKYSANGFKQSYSALELPPYEALNAAAFKWRTEIAHK